MQVLVEIGEQSGRTKLIYVFNEGRGERNPRITSTLDIPLERQSIEKILVWNMNLNKKYVRPKIKNFFYRR